MKEKGWAKEYLSGIREKDIKIRQLKRQIKDLEDLQGRTQGVRYDSSKVQSSFHGYAGEDRAVEIMELERQIQEELSNMIKLRGKIIKQINGLDSLDYRELLTLKYCYYMPLTKIADEMDYSFDWVRHMHGHALTAFEEKYAVEKLDTQKHIKVC